MPSWYVKVTDFKDRMVELNQQINWTPNHVKDGLFGKWLENARDWSISRNRFWGCPVPVWKSDDPQYPRLDVYGSIAEMEKDFGVEIKDLHRPFIDELTRPNPDDPSGKSMMRRVSDVLDCWFESGSMPYAQAHYPFENKDWFEGHFPADFIVEYQAQTRGWFYTLMVLSTALFDKPPFLNCICHGVILDENSQKLSKRLRNYADPHDIFASYGADAMRWFMAKSTVMRGNDLNIDKDGNAIRETLRLSLKPIWNSYNFFTLYANADNLQAEFDLTSDNLLDRYILSKTKHLVLEVKRSLDDYDTPNACSLSESFFEILNNWYIRRNRQRFWNSEKNQDKQSAYNTLYSVLHITMRAIAPLLPFISEEIFKALDQKAVSVHLEDFPDVSSIKEDAELVAKMDNVREVCNAALSIRAKENLRIRLPLAELKIIGSSLLNLADYADIIADELNVKKVSFIEDLGDLAELKLQLNFPILGKRLGARMKEIASACREGKWQKTAEGVQISDVTLQPEEYSLALVPKDQKSMLALSSNDALIALDLNITKELEQEGLARDIVRLIQQDRKAKDFDISDHIKVELGQVTKSVSESIGQFSDYIKKQVLADDIIIADNGDYEFTHELEGEKLLINLTKK
jgi:isoleucyl-tRNA synthetase